jgi:hypothetical protein
MRFIIRIISSRSLLFFNFVNYLFKFYWYFTRCLWPIFFCCVCCWLGINILWFYSVKSNTWGISFCCLFWRCSLRLLGRWWNWFFNWRYLIKRYFWFVKITLRRIMFIKVWICFWRTLFDYLLRKNFLILEIFKILILSNTAKSLKFFIWFFFL